MPKQLRKLDAQVELWISLGAGQTEKNKAAFGALKAQEVAIDADFGDELDWEELPDADGCRIRHRIATGGYKSPPEQWPVIQDAMVDAMVRLGKTMRTRIANLVL